MTKLSQTETRLIRQCYRSVLYLVLRENKLQPDFCLATRSIIYLDLENKVYVPALNHRFGHDPKSGKMGNPGISLTGFIDIFPFSLCFLFLVSLDFGSFLNLSCDARLLSIDSIFAESTAVLSDFLGGLSSVTYRLLHSIAFTCKADKLLYGRPMQRALILCSNMVSFNLTSNVLNMTKNRNFVKIYEK